MSDDTVTIENRSGCLITILVNGEEVDIPYPGTREVDL